ncbi:MAG TPA: peptidyl-dipeptidase Dcp [Flavobacteriaceae bacterium]|nr:peptidyl-dipeptidase Dcp [Flavobacteriaceae bacterium]
MKKYSILPIVAVFALTTSCGNNGGKKENQPENDSTLSSENPFYSPSALPLHAPDFSKIKTDDFRPAIVEGMKAQLEEIIKIANSPEEPTFENTVVALEKSGRLLDRTTNVFYLLTGANTNPELQQLQEEIAPKMAAHADAIYLNPKLFERIKTIYKKRKSLKLKPESLHLVEYLYQQFVLAGANLSHEEKEKLKELNKEEASLSAKFTNQLLAATKNGALVINDQSELTGLSESEMKKAAQTAEANGNEGSWTISLQNTTQQPALQNLKNRTTRQKLFEASWSRAEKGDANDTRKTISRIAEIRAEKAKIMGFPNFAAWNLQDQMAKTPEAVEEFLTKLVGPAVTKAKSEAADIQKLIDQQKGGFQLAPWDWNFYAEQVRKARYDLDESQIKPYFELNNVLENGVFFAANKLYGLSFKERKDLPVYQEDVRVFDVIDKDGSQLGLFYCDYFKRENKQGGAWMSNLVGQSKLLGTKPVIYNVANFTKPVEGQPALLSFDEVTTLFHEFGHALHGLFADQIYPSLSGTNTPRDFVEFPSQFNEHWALEPSVLKNYAVHYKTGKPMPQSLVDKIKKAATFNQGYALTELLAAAQLDMQWHTISANDTIKNVDNFEAESLRKTNLDFPPVPPRYRSSYFMHIWGNGYAASYYAYIWTEMLDDDAYSWFEQNGGMTRENGQRFRDMILSRGNTEDFNKLFRDFRGHEPDITPMLIDRGLVKP